MLAIDRMRGIAMPNLITGSASGDRLIGLDRTDDFDLIKGLDGDDIISGGLGRDLLDGGNGDDRFEFINPAQDFDVGELIDGGKGRDTIVLSGAKTLANFFTVDSIEAIEFVGAVGSASSLVIQASRLNKSELSTKLGIRGSDGTDRLTVEIDSGKKANLAKFSFKDWSAEDEVFIFGSGGKDFIKGTSQRDVIDGRGGGDKMAGGRGNDVYYMDSRKDEIVEKASGGTQDQIFTTVSVKKLAKNVEILTMLGTNPLDATGNGQSNQIFGNAGANRINGEGGDDNLYGGDGGDRIDGGKGADVIFGGRGNDILTGGKGKDDFYLTDALDAVTNVDTIRDFKTGEDNIFLSSAVMTGLAPGGGLPAEAFRVSTTGAALDADDRIIFDLGTGSLYYDPDGNGAAAATRFAILEGVKSLLPTDFIVI
jgi:Ca2+-binding RTX toxin-like protein